ncbi:MAG: LPS assembly lipoprotein LptE [Gammaproteobacteria bacterium]|jgi:LPS-assembly lipoprotein
MIRWLQISGLLLIACAVAACGFHLRGSYNLPEHLSPLFIDKDSMSLELYRELRSALVASGVGLTDDAAAASSVLKVNKEQRSRDVISVDTLGRAREYRLIYRLVFSLQASGEALIDKSNIQLTRNLLFDPETVLGVAQEREYVYADMIRDSAGQVLQKLQAIK